MAVCPAGRDAVGPYLSDRKGYVEEVLKPLQNQTETVYVIPGSDAEAYTSRKFPHKPVKRAGCGVRPKSAAGFLEGMDLIFQKEQSEGIDATYHFSFTGAETCSGTVVIRNKSSEVTEGLTGNPDIRITADAKTWIDFLAKEKNLLWALVQRKIRIKGSPLLMKDFGRCFPM